MRKDNKKNLPFAGITLTRFYGYNLRLAFAGKIPDLGPNTPGNTENQCRYSGH